MAMLAPLFVAAVAHAQPRWTDTIPALRDARHDTVRVRLMAQMADDRDDRFGLDLATEAVRVARTLCLAPTTDMDERTAPRLLARALYVQATAQGRTDAEDGAVLTARSADSLYAVLHDTVGRVESLGLQAQLLRDMGERSRSIELYAQALRLSESNGLWEYEATLHNNIGVSLGGIDRASALAHFEQARAIQEAHNERKGLSSTLNNMGMQLLETGDLKGAMDRFRQSLALRKEIKARPGSVAVIHQNLGGAFARMGLRDSAEANFREALRLRMSIGNHPTISQSYSALAGLYLREGRLPLAKAMADSAGRHATLGGILTFIKDTERVLYQVDSARGDMAGAFAHLQRHIGLRDSLMNEQTRLESLRAEARYQFGRREADLLLAQSETESSLRRQQLLRKVFMGASVLMLLAAGVFLIQRNRIAKERHRSEELLLNILPHEVADELKDKGEAEARLMEHVTVLFTDFKGFTQMSELVTPKELVKDLHECFSAFDRICGKYGIEKIKTIGDAYMAAGGLPTPCYDHAERVVSAALEMAAFVAEGKARRQALGQPFFEIRIGIHTGPVVAGIVGVKKFQYDIWGDTVNTASRMESSGEVGKVNISEATYQLVKYHFHCEYRGEIEAKGKGKMGMWFVEDKKAVLPSDQHSST
jgi:class 3 adenylate cyclase